jgi:predicted Rossmann fold nucleotide-binding protein DprA/Smf involved in DNA uptake
MKYLGNKHILELHKIGFLSSRRCPADVVLKSYEWAKHQRKNGNCIVSGNHSQIEKDVFEILLRGSQPLILVLGRTLYKRWPSGINQALSDNRLLIISPFDLQVNRLTTKSAKIRNKFILEFSNEIMIGYKTQGGMLDKQIEKRLVQFSTL